MEDVRVYEISAELQESEQSRDELGPLEIRLLHDASPPDSEDFGVLLRFATSVPFGPDRAYRVEIAIEGRFHVAVDPSAVDPKLLKQFKSRDAIILLWPYLRQTFHDLSSRMRLGISPLPVVDARALVRTPHNEEQPDS
jgi:preprotein translocase subunit SecB